MTSSPMVGSTFFGLDISQFATSLLSIRRRISKRVLVLEFGPDSLLLAEATLTQAGVRLAHVSSFPLPPEALDRGVPAEPLKMASLLQAFCTEKKIPAHRAAVVLPPELAFQRLLDLPAYLTTDEAREYVLNPTNGLQIPFPLTQTDFDLFPVSRPTEQPPTGDTHLYMLTAVPEVLVDPIVEMLQAADLELQLLELGSYSQLRNYAADLITLSSQQVDLVLELLPDCSNLLLVSCSGLLQSERLAAIRNLPELDVDPEQIAIALESGLMAENLLFNGESYLPISDLDLRVLVADLRDSLERFYVNFPGGEIRRLILTGPNSSHPSLADLLAENLGIPVVLFQHSDTTGLAGLSLGDLLLQSGLGRLIGLALGLLPSDQLTACSLKSHLINDQASHFQNNTDASADLLSGPDAQVVLEPFTPEAQSVPLQDEDPKEDSDYTLVVDIEPVVSLEAAEYSAVDSPIDFDDRPDALVPINKENVDADDSPLPSTTSPGIQEVSIEIPLDIAQSDSSREHETSSRSSLETDTLLDQEINADEDDSYEQWPSITASSFGSTDGISQAISHDSLNPSSINDTSRPNAIDSEYDELLSETEFASADPVDSANHSLENDLELIDEFSSWPSITSNDQQDLNISKAVVNNPDELPSRSKDYVDEVDGDQTSDSSLEKMSFHSSSPSDESTEPLLPLSNDQHVEQSENPVDFNSNLSEDLVNSNENSEGDESTSGDDIPLDDSACELGELRFADED